jgi:hypothetical protein
LSGAEPGSAARSRLLVLARRPAHQALIDRLTAERVSGENPDVSAVSLRIAVLDAQNRSAEAGPFLAALASRATSIDLLATIRSEAGSRGFDAAVERADERETAIASDPLDRMRARLALMRFYEGKRDIARAEAAVEELYRENPVILGVVRATVDFHWRNKMPAKAVGAPLRPPGRRPRPACVLRREGAGAAHRTAGPRRAYFAHRRPAAQPDSGADAAKGLRRRRGSVH